MGLWLFNSSTYSIGCTLFVICLSSSIFFLFSFLLFLTPFFSVAVMLVDQCWDLLYLLHISSAAPFSPPAHLFSTPFFTSRPQIMLLLSLYSLFTSSLHGTNLLIWLTPEHREQQVWAEVREGHRHKNRPSRTCMRTVGVCMHVYVHVSKDICGCLP